MALSLDVVIPTYNRAELLANAIRSLFEADIPTNLSVTITAVDNNSTDGTADIVRSLQQKYGTRLRYFREQIQGRSAALNRGISESRSELVAMIDDDEEIDANWYKVIFSVFSERQEITFMGGPYLPKRQMHLPEWLPGPAYRGVVGWMENGDKEYLYGEKAGILNGGNAVLRRDVFNRVGLYNLQLGRSKTRLTSMEDQDMYQRLLAGGERGLYSPRLIIYHNISQDRLTKSYHRRWCFWTGVSVGIQERIRPSPVVRVGRIPRYMIRAALLSFGKVIWGVVDRQNPAKWFAQQLAVCQFAGTFAGLYFWRLDQEQDKMAQK